MNYTIIRIKNARFYAHHGVLDAERMSGGLFEIDAEMTCDVTEAEAEDNLKKTLDYEMAYKFIKEVISQEKFFLIEALAYRIALKIIENFSMVQKVVINVRKPSPPVGGLTDYVEVEHSEYRHAVKDEQ
ncbi:MAG: dihydroneopterin aldolase [Ignavibacteria bacterium]